MSDDKNPLDLEAWEPQAPTRDFAERVLLRIRDEGEPAGEDAQQGLGAREAPAQRRARRWGLVIAGLAAAAVTAAIAIRAGAPPVHGEATADGRVEVSIGTRARAVLEPGARMTWNGDDVVQARGEVFYRVEPGAHFRVHTPAGEVEVRGTCFSVKVRANEGEAAMQRRDVKAGAIGAAISALAVVAVYEGRVAASRGGERVDLRAGEIATLGGAGVRKGAIGEGEETFDSKTELAEEALSAANGNLVAQVSEYKKRLEAIAAQKAEVEKKLETTEKQLEAARADGAVPPKKHEFDLGPEEWKELAKNGTIKALTPCLHNKGWEPSAEQLQELGLAPQDGAVLRSAYERSNERMRAAILPICAKELGSVEAAEKIGPGTCQHLVLDMERTKSAGSSTNPVADAMKMVGEIRAGLRPMPGPNEPLHPVAKMFLAVTSESKAFEGDLAASLGPEEAHRLVFSGGMCMGSSTWGDNRSKAPRPK